MKVSAALLLLRLESRMSEAFLSLVCVVNCLLVETIVQAFEADWNQSEIEIEICILNLNPVAS